MNRITLILLAVFAALLAACGDQRTSEEHLAEAEAFLANDAYRPAMIELKNALVKDGGNAQARLLLGRASLAIGDLASAEKELSQALDLGVATAEVYPDYAQVLLAQGEHEALRQLDVSELEDEGRSTVRSAQALSLLQRGEPEAAMGEIDQVLDSPPVSTFALLAGARISALRDPSGEEARYLLNQALEQDADYAPAWSLLGDVAVRNGDLAAAEEHYSKAIAASQNNFGEYYKRALVRVSAQQYDGVEKDLNAMKGVAASHPGVSFVQGLLLMGRDEPEEARPYFDKAALEPAQYPLALYYLAGIQRQEGSLATARNTINQFLTLAPDNEAGRKLGAAIAYEERNFGRVTALLQPVVANNPTDIESLNLLANSLLAGGDSERGMELLERVAELQPESAEALTRLGAGMLATGRQELGMQNLQAALLLEPRYERAEQALVTAYIQQGDFEAAIKQATEYLNDDPEDVARYHLLGRVYLAAGDAEAAREQFLAALTVSPGDPYASQVLAAQAMQQQDFGAARTFYEGALAENPENLQTLIDLAALNALEGKEDAMVEVLRRANDAHPATLQPKLLLARYHLLRSENQAVVDLLGELPEVQRELPPVAMVAAEARLNLQDYAAARRSLERLVEQQPGDPRGHFLLARALAGIDAVPRAIESLERAVELRPDFVFAHVVLARLYLLSDRPDELDAEVAVLRELAPEDPDVMRLEAGLANQRGDRAAALERLEAVFASQPSTDNAIALAMQQRASGNASEAIVLLSDWVGDNSEDATALNALAQLLSAEGDREAAIRAYTKVVQLDEDNIAALNNLAWQLRNSEPEKALGYIERAIAASPDGPSAILLDTRAMIYLETGDLRNARRSIDEALIALPEHPSVRFSSARISMAEGDREAAARELSALLESDRPFAEKAQAEELLAELQQDG